MTITQANLPAASAGLSFRGGLSPHQSLTAAPLTRARWAMAVDSAKCLKQPNCTKCIDACNQAHNVPSIPDPRHEVRWIWKEPFEHAFPAQRTTTGSIAPRPPCCSATTATIRRACASARRRPPASAKTASLRWTGTAASAAAIAWPRARTAPAASTGRTRGLTSTISIPISHAHQGRGRKVHFCCTSGWRRPPAGLRGGVPGEGAGIRQPGRPAVGDPRTAPHRGTPAAQARIWHTPAGLLHRVRIRHVHA